MRTILFNSITTITFLFVLNTSRAQYELWQFQGYSIGVDAPAAGYAPMGAMPDIALINSTYYMYYVAKYGTANAIWYATSPDMINWTVQDTIMTASLDPANRIYNLGGPGILKLDNGNYRLFYRTSQDVVFPAEPEFHIRSMISSDGINFTHEAGVRVECQPYLADSYFLSASHPAVYKDAFGNTRAIITGRDSSMVINQPAGLYTATSPDEGLTWENFTPLYDKCHDPVVVLDSGGVYHMYTSYLGSAHREVTSIDGTSWPVVPDSMTFMQSGSILTEESTPYLIADLGAGVLPTGEIVIYSNHRPSAPGAWINIAYFYIDLTSGIDETATELPVLIYPNPATDLIYFDLDETQNHVVHFYDALGQLIYSEIIENNQPLDCSEWNSGLYFYSIFCEGEILSSGKLIKQ